MGVSRRADNRSVVPCSMAGVAASFPRPPLRRRAPAAPPARPPQPRRGDARLALARRGRSRGRRGPAARRPCSPPGAACPRSSGRSASRPTASTARRRAAPCGVPAPPTAWPSTASPARRRSARSACPRAAARPARSGSSASAVLERIAQCESGGDPTTDTGNGYYGKYQFSRRHVAAVGRHRQPGAGVRGARRTARGASCTPTRARRRGRCAASEALARGRRSRSRCSVRTPRTTPRHSTQKRLCRRAAVARRAGVRAAGT